MSQTNRIYRECGLNSRATKISKSHQLLLISMRTLHAIMQQFAPLLHKDNELSPVLWSHQAVVSHESLP